MKDLRITVTFPNQEIGKVFDKTPFEEALAKHIAESGIGGFAADLGGEVTHGNVKFSSPLQTDVHVIFDRRQVVADESEVESYIDESAIREFSESLGGTVTGWEIVELPPPTTKNGNPLGSLKA